VKQNFIVIAGFAAALAIAPALAEDLTAGKSPAQLFRSDCGTCHHSPNGLVKERGNVGNLTAFLRQHYTTKAETAAAMAAYVSELSSPGGGAARHSDDAAQPSREHTRGHSGGDSPAAAAPTDPDESAAGRPRRHADGNRRPRQDDDVPRPRRGIPAQKPNASAGGEAQVTGDPVSRRRSHHLSSDLDSRNGGAQAAKLGTPPGTPKTRKRHSGDAAAAARRNTDAPPAAPAVPEPSPAAPSAPAPAAAPAVTAPSETPSGEQK
jgi:hypothetical protein